MHGVTSSPPRIGITTYRERARWGLWDTTADVLFTLYADAVVQAGGLPLLLPPVDPALAPAAVAAVDGLVIAGGADVDPACYRAARSAHTGPAQPHRDAWELALATAAVGSVLPVLGICRGMQILDVALGGTLEQHLPDIVGHVGHGPVPGEFGRHEVRLDPQSRLAVLLGGDLVVATHHHQAVRELGSGLRACGWAADGTVEAIELDGPGWVAGVQWHPEAYDGAALFAGFVAVCASVHDGGRR
jgi:gamma-glutamyl-gamma-aminobutyrate hydrolase PuuD